MEPLPVPPPTPAPPPAVILEKLEALQAAHVETTEKVEAVEAKADANAAKVDQWGKFFESIRAALVALIIAVLVLATAFVTDLTQRYFRAPAVVPVEAKKEP